MDEVLAGGADSVEYETVRASATGQFVPARTAGQPIVAEAAAEQVVARPSQQRVIALASVDTVGTGAPFEAVVERIASQGGRTAGVDKVLDRIGQNERESGD